MSTPMQPALAAPPAPAPEAVLIVSEGQVEPSAGQGRIATRPSLGLKWQSMAQVAVKMMFYDPLKMAGTVLGVVFAVLLSNQQAATFMGLLAKNTMFVDHAGADLWIAPALTETLQPGKALPVAALIAARTTPGVAWAEPILYGGTSISLPGGGSEQATLIGTRGPAFRGGPWNIVAGSSAALGQPDTMIFEDSEREKMGGLNLGSKREVGGHIVQVGGFTSGLLPFGPSYAFAEYDLARSMLHTASDQESFVLVGAADPSQVEALKAQLQSRVGSARVLTKAEYSRSIIRYLLIRTPIGITFGTSALFGLIIGFVIVSLSMFSAVVDNIREFGTLKAIGATTLDLAKVLFVQAIIYALIGSGIGLLMISQIAAAVRSPKFAMVLPPWLLIGTTGAMIVLCIIASCFSLVRLRKVEPAMVF